MDVARTWNVSFFVVLGLWIGLIFGLCILSGVSVCLHVCVSVFLLVFVPFALSFLLLCGICEPTGSTWPRT